MRVSRKACRMRYEKRGSLIASGQIAPRHEILDSAPMSAHGKPKEEGQSEQLGNLLALLKIGQREQRPSLNIRSTSSGCLT